ncbi:MAG: leucine-rich repeat domain-containing protein, partial [Ureaplasma sp.]|nr:leucine-rich repeat domain-containing protein [Ureaplasma sp.]
SEDQEQPIIKDEFGLVYANPEKTDLIAYLPQDTSAIELTIPASVRVISNAYINGKYTGAFENSKLTTINFDENSQLQSIEDHAFKNSSSLETLAQKVTDGINPGLPNTLLNIGNESFKGTKLNVTLSLPNVVSINESAFEDVKGANFAITNLNSLQTLGSAAFKSSSLKILDLSSTTLTSLPSNCFTGSQIVEVSDSTSNGVKLPNTITNVSNAFQGCKSLVTLNLPSTISSIVNSAFSGCTSLSSITLPSGLTQIPIAAFQGCSNLSNIDLSSLDKLTTINSFAFSNCSTLTSVKMPKSLTTIGSFAFAINESATKNNTNCSFNFTDLSRLATVEMGAFYNLKMNLENYTSSSSSENVTQRANESMPCLDLSETQISSFNPLAFNFNSSTPISVIKLSAKVAISNISTSSPFTFNNTDNAVIQIVGGKDVTSGQMEIFNSMMPTGVILGVSKDAIKWTTEANNGYDQYASQATNGLKVNEITLATLTNGASTTELTKENLAKYLTIGDLQLPKDFQSFGQDTFANTTVNQITFGTTQEPISYTTTSGTNSSDELATIMKLFKSSTQESEDSIGGSSVIQDWNDLVVSTRDTTNSSGSNDSVTDTGTTTQPTKKTKTINGLVWTYDSTANTISCLSVDQYKSKNNGGFEIFKAPVKVVINVQNNFGSVMTSTSSSQTPSISLSKVK